MKIIGTWMEKKKSQMHGQVSQDLFSWKKAIWRMYMVLEEAYEETNNFSQKCGNRCLMHQNVKRSNSGPSRNQSSVMPDNLRGIFFSEPDDAEFKHTMNIARRKLEIPMPASNALQDTGKKPRGNLQQCWEKQDQVFLYCRCRRIYESAVGRNTAKVSWRSHIDATGINSLSHCKFGT